MKRILLIEDDKELTELLRFCLHDEGYEVESEYAGDIGFRRAIEERFDLLILDISLPGKNGFDICREIRRQELCLPIMMLTARSEEVDRILGLEFGADDFISKPFSVRELTARIKALFRRIRLSAKILMQEDAVNLIDRGRLKIDCRKRKVFIGNQVVNLTPTEYRLLKTLASHPGRNYTKEKLLQIVWGHEFHGFKHTVSSHINRLRSKIEKDPHEPNYILTSWGMGYNFNENW